MEPEVYSKMGWFIKPALIAHPVRTGLRQIGNALLSEQYDEDPMTTGSAKDVCLEEETTVGSYFVSNYPPYSFWSPERVGDAYGVLDRAPARQSALGIYLHIPFCRKRCHFCYF